MSNVDVVGELVEAIDDQRANLDQLAGLVWQTQHGQPDETYEEDEYEDTDEGDFQPQYAQQQQQQPTPVDPAQAIPNITAAYQMGSESMKMAAGLPNAIEGVRVQDVPALMETVDALIHTADPSFESWRHEAAKELSEHPQWLDRAMASGQPEQIAYAVLHAGSQVKARQRNAQMRQAAEVAPNNAGRITQPSDDEAEWASVKAAGKRSPWTH